jgi:hypothetical protein
MRFRKKSGGMPAFPTSRFLDLRNRSYVESLGGYEYLDAGRLQVRKVGMPPLFNGRTSGFAYFRQTTMA